MRILHISARADTGGGPEVIRQLVAQAPPAIEHWVACPAEPPYWQRLEALVGAGRMLPLPHRRFDTAALGNLVLAVRRHGIDVLHSHGPGGGLYGRLAAWWTGRASVHTFHGWRPGAAKLLAETGMAAWTSMAVAVSHSEAESVRRAVPWLGRRMTVIPNGIAPTPETGRRSGGDRVRVLLVGRLVDQKDPLAVVEIAEHCRHMDFSRRYEFRVAGDGPLAGRLAAAVRARRLEDSVVLLGRLESCAEEYRRADLLLSTSRWEGLALAVVEAMWAGLPVVASRVTGNVDAVAGGRTGYLFDRWDRVAAAAWITHLGARPEAREELGRMARRRAEREFSAETMARSYAGVYEEAARA